MGKTKSPTKGRSKRRIMDLSSPRMKKFGGTKRMKIVNKLRKSNRNFRKSVRDRNLSANLVDRFVEEDSSAETQSINIPIPVAETITSKLADMTCNKLKESSDNQDDDDCVIVDVTPASVICLDEGETEINMPEPSCNSNIISNHMHNQTLDSISSFGDSLFNNNPDGSNQLFVFDPKPGFNGSRIPLYHSITSCAQSTPLRDNCGPDAINTEDQTFKSAYKTISVAPQSSRKNQRDSDVILIQDEVESVISLKSNNTTRDESVIFCGYGTVNTPIRRFEATTPSQNKTRLLSPFKRSRPGRIINRSRSKTAESGSSPETLNETLRKSFRSPSTSDKRIIIIDGCNVAFGHGNNKKFSAEGIEIALKYFERKGYETKIVVPQFRLRIQQSTNQALMQFLQETDKLVVTPSKNLPGKMSSSYDDRFILQLADEFDAAIISNDNYRDLLQENPAWKNIIESRVIGYTWLKDFFMVPTDPYGKSGPKLDDILNKKV